MTIGLLCLGGAARESPPAENRRLLAEIRVIHAESRRTYGSPRIHATLQAQGQRVSTHRVARLMRAGRIRAKTVKTWLATTDSAHPYPVVPNTLNHQFAVAAPNRVWAGDITYVWSVEGWLYLAVVLDLYSRRVCRILDRLFVGRPVLEVVILDNGPEFA